MQHFRLLLGGIMSDEKLGTKLSLFLTHGTAEYFPHYLLTGRTTLPGELSHIVAIANTLLFLCVYSASLKSSFSANTESSGSRDESL